MDILNSKVKKIIAKLSKLIKRLNPIRSIFSKSIIYKHGQSGRVGLHISAFIAGWEGWLTGFKA